MKITPAQKRELLILLEFRVVITNGYSHRHLVLMRLAAIGLVKSGRSGFENMFNLTEKGIEYMNLNFPESNSHDKH